MKSQTSASVLQPICVIGLGVPPVRKSSLPRGALNSAGLPTAGQYTAGLPTAGQYTVALPPVTLDLVQKADALVGGRSQLALFPDHPAEKLVVGADVENLYRRIEYLRNQGRLLVALCSGDPLYFGLGARLAERFGPDALRVFPGLSSIQAAAAFLGLPWEHMRSVSLHGRSDPLPLAHALMTGSPVCLLCDAAVSPPRIANWLLERGCRGLDMHLLDDLRLAAGGSVIPSAYARHKLEDAACLPEPGPIKAQRVIILAKTPGHFRQASYARPFGLDDAGLATDKGLFTKRPIRAAGLAALGIEASDIIWDIGAGSGAVSIDAARLACRGRVFAIEAKESRVPHLQANRRAFGALNMEIVPMPFPACLEQDFAGQRLPGPHKIFVGGGLGGDAETAGEMLRRAWQALLPGGRLVVHCVLLSSLELARSVLDELAARLEISSIQAALSAPVGNDVQLKALNPVFLVTAWKKEAL